MANRTSLGMDERLQATLGYLLPVILPIIWLIMEKQNRFVRVNAVQSLLLAGVVLIARAVLGILGSIISFVPLLGPLVTTIVSIVFTIAVVFIWVLLMVRTIQGLSFKIPYISELSERLA